MKQELVFADFPEMREDDYQKVVARWLEIDDGKKAERIYQEEVFPRSCYRIRQQAPKEPIELLFVPVGTQPYAPIICCLGNPALKTVLLITEESKDFAQQVEEALQGQRSFQRVLIKESDPGDMVQKVTSAYDVLGQPQNVVCDITGGTKVMTASLAGIAATNGWRQVYVHSDFVRYKGSHSERIIDVPSFFQYLGGWNYVQARKLAWAGQFRQAAHLLQLAADDSLASAKLELDIKRFKLAGLYREANLSQVCRKIAPLAKKYKTSFPPQTLELLSGEDHRGLSYWLAQTLVLEGQKLAACGALLELEITTTPQEVTRLLKSLKRQYGKEWSLSAWQPIDDFLGYKYSQEASLRG